MRDFIIHLDNLAGFEILTNEEKGILFTAMIEYAKDGTEPTLQDRALLVIWLNLRKKMDLDFRAYDETLRKRSEAGRASGEARRTKANSVEQNEHMLTHVESVEQNEHMLTHVESVEQNATNGTKLKPKPKLKPNNNIYSPAGVKDLSDADGVKDQSDAVPYREIIDYLNNRISAHYLATSKNTREKIRARWREGFRLDDFKAVIDNTAERWEKDAKMRDFLRPETLFSPKFESYLNLKPAQTVNKHGFEQRDDIDYKDLEAALDMQLASGFKE